MKITLAHGSGGLATTELINDIFAEKFSNPVLDMMEDSAVVDGAAKIAVTTDSFVVNPVIFKGGDIGRLAICGTVNDLLMRCAVPKYITCGFILEEGLDISVLKTVVASMADTAKEAGVVIVAGDTKVIEGSGGMYINTAGVGFVNEDICCKSAQCEPSDVIILSGNLGDHHAAIMSDRMNIENNIESDCAPLCEMVLNMCEIDEEALPVTKSVASFCKILGLDPLYMGNEGKLAAIVPYNEAEKALSIIRRSRYGENAVIAGRVKEGKGVIMNTRLGGRRGIGVLVGEGLPRIC